jgi:hypothetical protein
LQKVPNVTAMTSNQAGARVALSIDQAKGGNGLTDTETLAAFIFESSSKRKEIMNYEL